MAAEISFKHWCDGPVKRIFQEGMGFDIGRLSSWQEYTEAFVRYVGRRTSKGEKALLDDMREKFYHMSSGEQILFAACIFAGDYAWLADELMGEPSWQRIWWNLSENFQFSVGTAIARVD
jgi:hypothetical protein